MEDAVSEAAGQHRAAGGSLELWGEEEGVGWVEETVATKDALGERAQIVELVGVLMAFPVAQAEVSYELLLPGRFVAPLGAREAECHRYGDWQALPARDTGSDREDEGGVLPARE